MVERPTPTEVVPRHVIRIYRDNLTERLMAEIDGGIPRTIAPLKIRILQALTKGPLDRTQYLEDVLGKRLDETTYAERERVSAAQCTMKKRYPVRFPETTRASRYSASEVRYELPAKVKVAFEDGILESVEKDF